MTLDTGDRVVAYRLGGLLVLVLLGAVTLWSEQRLGLERADM